MLTSSGSCTRISRNPHGLSTGASTISTPESSNPHPTALTSRTCNHRLTFSLHGAAEEAHYSPGGIASPLSIDVKVERLCVEPERPLEGSGPQQHPARQHFLVVLLIFPLLLGIEHPGKAIPYGEGWGLGVLPLLNSLESHTSLPVRLCYHCI